MRCGNVLPGSDGIRQRIPYRSGFSELHQREAVEPRLVCWLSPWGRSVRSNTGVHTKAVEHPKKRRAKETTKLPVFPQNFELTLLHFSYHRD